MKVNWFMMVTTCWLVAVLLILQNRFLLPEFLVRIGAVCILLGGIGLAISCIASRYYRMQYGAILLGVAGFIAFTAGISALPKS